MVVVLVIVASCVLGIFILLAAVCRSCMLPAAVRSPARSGVPLLLLNYTPTCICRKNIHHIWPKIFSSVQRAMRSVRRRLTAESAPQQNLLYDGALLRKLMHVGTTSTSSLHTILRTLHDHQLLSSEEAVPDRSTLSRSHTAAWERVRHVERLPLENSRVFAWEFCDPNLLLNYHISHCASTRALFEAAIQTYPCSADSPWSLVVAFDEFSPGKQHLHIKQQD